MERCGSSGSRRRLSIQRLGDAAWIFAVDDLLQARDDVRMAVFAEFNHDPAAAHLVGDCAGCA